jgi:hypothetical protein
MKRAYFVCEKDADFGIAVIANSAKEAKKIGMRHDCCMDADFIDIRVTWKKNVDASKLPIGCIEGIEGLELGIYGYMEGEECPRCGHDGFITNVNGEVMCGDCEDKQNDANATDTDSTKEETEGENE